MNQIRQQIEETSSDYDREKLQERMAKLAGGVAVIKVGAATEIEMKEKKARVEDALHATRAAVEEGVVAGGGVALVRAQQAVTDLSGDNHDQDMGISIARRAMEEPLRQIVSNSGGEASVVLAKVADKAGNQGFNAQTDEYGDMIEMGILDPTKVVRTALQNASSIAGLLITTEASVAESPKDESPPAMPPGGGMDGMGHDVGRPGPRQRRAAHRAARPSRDQAPPPASLRRRGFSSLRRRGEISSPRRGRNIDRAQRRESLRDHPGRPASELSDCRTWRSGIPTPRSIFRSRRPGRRGVPIAAPSSG